MVLDWLMAMVVLFECAFGLSEFGHDPLREYQLDPSHYTEKLAW